MANRPERDAAVAKAIAKAREAGQKPVTFGELHKDDSGEMTLDVTEVSDPNPYYAGMGEEDDES